MAVRSAILAQRLATGTAGPDRLEGTEGDDTLDGAGGDDLLYGFGGADTLIGGDGNDTLDGGSGADLLQGGPGDDLFIVDHPGDRVREAPGQGSDTLRASVSFSLAGQFIEHLQLTGLAAIDGTGNSLNNRLTGNRMANTLHGLGGNDILDGGAGADRLHGGPGDDLFYVDDPGDRVIERSGEGSDTVIASIDFTLAGQFIEKLTLAGTALAGTGNSLANTLTGNALGNRLEGLGANDRLLGMGGDDWLLGGDGADILEGGEGDDRLDGGPGADRMIGGPGNDSFFVDDPGDRVIETSPEGLDTVYSILDFSLAGGFVNDLVLLGFADLQGIGNGTANRLLGNAGANRLAGGDGNDMLDGGDGNDILEGGAGADRLLGGAGDDILIGGAGYDILEGGAGIDRYRILAPNDGYDSLAYVPGEDVIEISAAAFGGGLVAGMDLGASGYYLPGATTATAAHGQFLSVGGVLSYDANGSAPGGSILVARTGVPVAFDDLVIIA
ncbi:calcium-binding protein [Roseomonas sp. USHLN139]|uniref:calcium-binding protein n=1 Tax=Roseomonas sp. USHLN139 TaxID=3081298 RepID=UPI003B022CD5